MLVSRAATTTGALLATAATRRINSPRGFAKTRAMAPILERAERNKHVGFVRKELGTESLTGTVKLHDCHAFFVHGTGTQWAPKEFDAGDAATAMNEALRVAAGGAFKGGVFQFEPGANKVGKVKLNLSEHGERGHAAGPLTSVSPFSSP